MSNWNRTIFSKNLLQVKWPKKSFELKGSSKREKGQVPSSKMSKDSLASGTKAWAMASCRI